MPAPVSNNTPSKARIDTDKRAKKQAHAEVQGKLRDLDYAHKTLAEDLISSYIKGDSSFNGYKTTFIRRLKYLLIRFRDPRSSNELLHLLSQFMMLDQIRSSVGISLKEIRPAYNPSGNGTEVKQSTDIHKNPSMLYPSGLPKELGELLNVSSSGGINYLKYIKNNVEMLIFADFTKTDELKGIDKAGLSDPISRTALINTITYLSNSYEKVQAPDWALASQIVHEAAHIELDWEQDAEPAVKSDDDTAERYAFIMEYNFLNDLLSNVEAYKLEKHAKNIELTIKEVERTINHYNYELGYRSGDFSLK